MANNNDKTGQSTDRVLVLGGRRFEWGSRTYVMGVVNVTPDSFSGDGIGGDVRRAVDQALRMEDEGADIIDIGGESSRPPGVYADARPVPADEELARVLPVLRALEGRLGVPVSIDTRKAAVAAAAVGAGASMVNDVTMLTSDAAMASTVAGLGAPIVISHTRERASYPEGVVAGVVADLRSAALGAEDAGVAHELVILDPGIGFAKKATHSIEMQRGLRDLAALGYPVLIGTSRKSSIGAVLGVPPDERLEGTAATIALAVERGADIVRVHDVKEMVRVARMSDAIVRGWAPSGK